MSEGKSKWVSKQKGKWERERGQVICSAVGDESQFAELLITPTAESKVGNESCCLHIYILHCLQRDGGLKKRSADTLKRKRVQKRNLRRTWGVKNTRAREEDVKKAMCNEAVVGSEKVTVTSNTVPVTGLYFYICVRPSPVIPLLVFKLREDLLWLQ